MFTIFLHDVAASVPLLMRAFPWIYHNSLWNDSAKSKRGQYRRLQTAPTFNYDQIRIIS